MNCDCITRINEKLAEQNLELDTSIVGLMSPQPYVTLSVSTHWKDSSKKVRGKKPTTILVTFCPFCGVNAQPATNETNQP